MIKNLFMGYSEMLKVLEKIDEVGHWKEINVDDSGGKKVKDYIWRQISHLSVTQENGSASVLNKFC